MEKPLGTKTVTLYKVETTWPDTDKPEDAEKFSTYYSHAYTLVDDPGKQHAKLACIRRADLFGKRIGNGENMYFPDNPSAQAVAKLLREQGRMGAGWEGPEDWRKKYRGELKTRVVLEIVTTHREIIE